MSSAERYIRKPHIGLIVLGRKRGGFDPEWGAEVRERAERAVKELGGSVACTVATDIAEFRKACAELRPVDVFVLSQPTIADGRLAMAVLQEIAEPVVLWATPEKPTGEMISANSLVGTHVMASNLLQAGGSFELVYGDPDDPTAQSNLASAIHVVYAAKRFARARVGWIGYHAPGFTDLHPDTQLLGDHGISLYHEGVEELIERVGSVDSSAAAAQRKILEELGLPGHESVDSVAMEAQGSYLEALRALIAEQELDALAFRCWPELPKTIGQWPYLALAWLVGAGYPVAMEGDVHGALAHLVAEALGIGPVYLSDWLEHDSSGIVIWHTGAAPFDLCEPIGTERGPRLGVQFNNRLPTVVDADIAAGLDATLFTLWRCEGRLHLAALEGKTAKPRRRRMATNGRFETEQVDVRRWFDDRVHEGMSHHVCIVAGHHADRLRRVARLSGVTWHPPV